MSTTRDRGGNESQRFSDEESLQRPSTRTLVKQKKTGRKCFAPPQNATVAYLAYNLREEAAFKSALDAVNAGESPGHFSLPPFGPALPHACACLFSLSPLERGMGLLVIIQ
jgi:hypothetical protein